ncbi:MAG: ABC transporter permease, partial [Gammaproteobacteria bacterium]|nr:ABC transporter permease [Gemmatimonadota bacterium]NIR82015.1 ABC transporter permease [Gammaproteobacteria bacterium]NIR89243.1 ABC transporter permease [Gammaproteobacteria bacterium]NIU03125.1 ABC transporter permease [Gammaproteobacteria bacterium]NIX84400.1 FtsX-like permease family protein [Gammaproteobacteria bacterium]
MRWIGEVTGDVRWALRAMRRRPGFTAVAVVTLALGIGSNSAVFTLVSAGFMAPLPYERPKELVTIWHESAISTVAPGTYFAWKETARSFAAVTAFNANESTISGDGNAERVMGSVVTPDFFAVLGARPELGATFTEESARQAAGALVVLSHGLWVGRYGGDPGIVGRTVRLAGRPHTVVGVMPSSFRQPEQELQYQRAQFWRPLLLDERHDDFYGRFLRTVARLAPGVSVEQANVELGVIAERLAQENPDEERPFAAVARRLSDDLRGNVRPALALLMGAGAAVLLLVCANVANLTLARGQERQREFAVRAALGCSRGRLFRQILVEGIVVAVAGAAVGTVAVLLTRRGLQSVQERYFSVLTDVSVDIRVVAVTAFLALVAGVLFAMPLARTASRRSLRTPLVEGGGQSGWGPSASGLRNALVVGQVALATMLLAVSALLLRSFDTLVSVPPGFDPRGRVTFDLYPPSADYSEPADRERFYREVLREVEAVPGVASVALASDLPFSEWNMGTRVAPPGQPYDDETAIRADLQGVSPAYFQVMGIPVLAGQVFEDAWPTGASVPVVVSRRLARMLVPGGAVVGQTIIRGSDPPWAHRIEAVVGDVRDGGYAAETEPILYVPFGPRGLRFGSVVVRAEGNPSAVVPGIRAAVGRVDPNIPAANLRSMDAMLASTVTEPRAASRAGTGVALLALLVAAAGIYGVLSYSVQVRTREIGIRMALGAHVSGIVSTVLGRSVRLLAVGLFLGLG